MEDRFREFYETYPRHVAPRAAEKAWKSALKRADAAVIIKGAWDYRMDPHRRSRPIEFTCHPATWLNADRWLDEYGSSVPEVAPVDLTHRFDEWDREHGRA
jgi:hypothetical protein